MQDIQVLSPTETSGTPQENYEALVTNIINARQNIGLNFMSLGQALDTIQSQELFRNGGFRSFQAFLRSEHINIAAPDADRFMAITRDPAFERNLNMGLSKMLELIKLPQDQRQHLLNEGATVNGQHKDIQAMNLKEMRQATQAMKREGKSRCDRCSRWVNEVRELDGKQYGHGADHLCYSQEIENRQALTSNSLPPDKLGEVLQIIKDATQPSHVSAPEATPLQWLPESLYQVYGQLLYAQQQSGGEVTLDSLAQEKEMLSKLLYLCQNRLTEIKDMSKALKELGEDSPSPTPTQASSASVPSADDVPW